MSGDQLSAAETAAREYSEAARACAWSVITSYSTSFSLASRLFTAPTRGRVASAYAMARIADEIVDGAFGGDRESARGLLQDYRARIDAAIAAGYSSDPIVHAFAETARWAGIGARQLDPFFASMEMDLDHTSHTTESLARYIHGSAEVIGEMCMLCFADGALRGDADAVAAAHALGSGFQKVNFLRDLRDDAGELGRDYFPGRDAGALTARDVAELCDDVDRDFARARTGVARIPGRDRVAVEACLDLFTELNRRLRAAGPEGIMAGRVRVPDRDKAIIVGRALARYGVNKTRRGAAASKGARRG